MTKRDSAREERFAKLVAVDGLSYVAAFCESASGYPKPEPTQSARVLASRMAKRTADLRAKLAKGKADADASELAPVSTEPADIKRLMNDTSKALMRAAEAASAHGLSRLSNVIKQSLSRHVGRVGRIENRHEQPSSTSYDSEEVDRLARRILERAQ